jgi:hypothetical protein
VPSFGSCRLEHIQLTTCLVSQKYSIHPIYSFKSHWYMTKNRKVNSPSVRTPFQLTNIGFHNPLAGK